MTLAITCPSSDNRSALDDDFKRGMRARAASVCVIAFGAGDERNGFTATSVTSLAADPHSLLFCVNRNSSSWPALSRASRFSVNILSGGQSAIAQRFSGADGVKKQARFLGAAWTGNDPPILTDALASFVCAFDEAIVRFSHAIVIGRILDVRAVASGGASALLYWRGAYEELGSGDAQADLSIAPPASPIFAGTRA